MNDKFWVIMSGRTAEYCSKRYESRGDAVKEATRLAELTTGVNYYVLEAIGVAHVHAPVPIYQEYSSGSCQIAEDITGAQDASILKGLYPFAPQPGKDTITYGSGVHSGPDRRATERMGDSAITETANQPLRISFNTPLRFGLTPP